jgi:hypothetical protein
LNALCAHHVLERLEYPSVAFRFQHQQFQEFYAALLLKRQLWELAGKDDNDANLCFGKKYLNEPIWDEPLRMIAEEIGMPGTQAPEKSDAVAAGRRLIELTLRIDPIFASELSRLCGHVVWSEVRSVLSERLRSWYRVADEHNRQCALAGMLATGDDEFIDIVLPLLTNDDQMVRARAYRRWGEFQLSTLGTEWRSIVNAWKEEHRIDFVREVVRNRRMAEIGESFALADPSAKVRAEAVKVLSWVGATDALDRVLTALDKEAFAEVLPKLVLRTILPSQRPRVMEVYSELLKESGDAIANIAMLMEMAELGNTNISESLKEQLTRCEAGRLGSPFVESALKIVRKNDPGWVSHWVAERIVDGSLWDDNWVIFVSVVPESLKESLLERIAGQSFQPIEGARIISVLSAVADPVLAERVFSRLCEVKQAISTSTAIGEKNETNWAISR